MKKTSQIIFFTFLFLITNHTLFAQDKATTEDSEFKETLYKKYKKEVQSYDKHDFDSLFFEFFKKQNDNSIILTQEEFYTYTIKIAIYSEKLGLLYKDQKESVQRTKQEWFDKNYSDYLKSKSKF
jgi:hypothetical protein